MARQRVEGAGLQWQEAADAQQLAERLGNTVAQCLRSALEQHGEASLVVSGGSTPAPVLRYLSGVDLDWSRVSVTLADERWVPPGHPDSNESLVRETLLQDKAATARFVPLYREGLSESDALPVVAADISAMHQPFTVVMLGMGGDGHTASLFPDAAAEELLPAMALDNEDVVAFLHPPSVSQARISLTRACLLHAENRFLHITGDAKCDVLAAALDSCEGGDWQAGHAPVLGLLTEQPARASVFWSP
ncbi:6-phosphogluconolactonase [Granulosicoccus sp. 3-233]|uniref:6-phosphogluconolactonase n=1 Tax=Granulosicoccus sp. 3-233 TaxID=3417969 RepID=UPI003D32606F